MPVARDKSIFTRSVTEARGTTSDESSVSVFEIEFVCL